MDNKEAAALLGLLEKAKADVKRLELEYRAVCECNEKIAGAVESKNSYSKIYKTCRYHTWKVTKIYA